METFAIAAGLAIGVASFVGWLILCRVKQLNRAVTFGGLTAIVLLVAAGAYPTSRFMLLDEPLQMAASAGDAAKVRDLLKRGANPNAEGEFGTPLANAVAANDIDCVRLLIAAGADVRIPAQDGKSLLRHAAFLGNADLVSELRRAGAVK